MRRKPTHDDFLTALDVMDWLAKQAATYEHGEPIWPVDAHHVIRALEMEMPTP